MKIQLASIEQLQNAITKARKDKPLVRVVSFGHYTVVNKNTGAAYDVFLGRDEEGKRASECNCKAGTPPSNAAGAMLWKPRLCYHVAAAAERHLQLAHEIYEAACEAEINVFDNVRYLAPAQQATEHTKHTQRAA